MSEPVASHVLHLLRHGEPEGAGRWLGATDAAPLAAGIAACVAQAEGLAIETVIASDLARARLAGAAIAVATGLPLAIDARWRELDFGQWDGLAPGDIDSGALARFWADPDADPPPGGERWTDIVARVAAALNELPPRPILVVTHGGAIRAALATLCGFDLRTAWALDLPYASLLTLRVWPGAAPGEPLTAQITGLRA